MNGEVCSYICKIGIHGEVCSYIWKSGMYGEVCTYIWNIGIYGECVPISEILECMVMCVSTSGI